MLSKSDVNIGNFLPLFADMGVEVAFLVPTPTGYEKSIMDATGPVRALLKGKGIHDYKAQRQGPEAKQMWPAVIITARGIVKTEASLYRPRTKKGDPRIWFKKLRHYCDPCNLLAIFVYKSKICVMNLSNPDVQAALRKGRMKGGLKSALGHKSDENDLYGFLRRIKRDNQSAAMELLGKMKRIHEEGFLESVTPGDPGVGDTLEHALGIKRNNSKSPDYKGVELKATRTMRNGARRTKTRFTLFTKVPSEGLSYKKILETYGKWQAPKKTKKKRWQLYDTLSANRVNAYGLTLVVDAEEDRLFIDHVSAHGKYEHVASWQMADLKEALLEKHHETFWVKAVSENRGGREFFRYEKILHTKGPNTSLLTALLETGKITVDLAAHFKENGKPRDHGMLFKMKPDEVSLLFGEPTIYDLETVEL